MQGEVYIPYTPIGGSNMSRMAEPTISGSSQDIEGGSPQEYVVLWVLPGGISGYDWSFILGHPGETFTDEQVLDYARRYGEDEISQTNAINQLLYNHVHEILDKAGHVPGYSWDAFNGTYGGTRGCIVKVD